MIDEKLFYSHIHNYNIGKQAEGKIVSECVRIIKLFEGDNYFMHSTDISFYYDGDKIELNWIEQHYGESEYCDYTIPKEYLMLDLTDEELKEYHILKEKL